MIPYEEDVVTEICGVGTTKIFGLLTIVLRGQQTEWTRRNVVDVPDFEGVAVTGII